MFSYDIPSLRAEVHPALSGDAFPYGAWEAALPGPLFAAAGDYAVSRP